MAEKQTVDRQQDNRKQAPNIKVAENYGKRPIDQLMADNPKESFVRVPVNSSRESLASRGLEPVISGGKAVEKSGYAVARRVDDTTKNEMKAEYEEATEQVSAVRKLDVSDKQSFNKKPTPSGR